MLDKKGSSIPYKPLGRQLKALRVALNESLAEASGAVEIDVRELASFELGQSRPSEDVLLLLLSHFGVKDEEAITLWTLAGYQVGQVQLSQPAAGTPTAQQPTKDKQILFTDVVDVIVNNYGVVMHFMQNGGANATPATVAKVGMSREHAKSVLQILQATLSQTEKNNQATPRQIDSPTDNVA